MNSSSPQVSEDLVQQTLREVARFIRTDGAMLEGDADEFAEILEDHACNLAMQSARTPSETAWDQPDSRVSEEVALLTGGGPTDE